MRIHRLILILLAVVLLMAPLGAFAGVFISVGFGPPALPVYEQPVCPAPGYIFAPGYWAYGPYGYFWVPGTWVLAPQPGYLWTPGYWGWGGSAFLWHEGYWGPTVGFYGGVPYGFGYTGAGYQGGYWRGNQFYYNRTVNNVNVTNVTNVYNTTVINNNTTRVSYNGGEGGIVAQPTPAEEAAAREQHLAPTPMQTQHVEAASNNHELLASVNQGRPPIAATAKAADFSRGVVTAKAAGAPYRAPANQPGAENRPGVAREVPRPPSANERSATAAGNARENAVPRPENNVPRPQAERTTPSPTTRNEVPRPPATAEREAGPRPETAPRPENQADIPRPASRGSAPRPESETESRQTTPRSEAARPEAAHPQATPHSEPEHSEPRKEERPPQ